MYRRLFSFTNRNINDNIIRHIKRKEVNQMARRPTPRKQAKLNVNYMRAMSQAQALYHERDLGRFVTFEQLLKEVGVNYKAKTVTEQNLKRLNKLTTLKGIYGATSSRHLRKRITSEWYKKQGVLQEEYETAKRQDKYKDSESVIIRTTLNDYIRYFSHWDDQPNKRYKYSKSYDAHVDIIERLEDALYNHEPKSLYRSLLASYITDFVHDFGTIDVEDLYHEMPVAHYHIIDLFDAHMQTFRGNIENFE